MIGKEHRVVFNNFLKFETFKKYDLILMNPPFSEGAYHLLKGVGADARRGTDRLHTECRHS